MAAISFIKNIKLEELRDKNISNDQWIKVIEGITLTLWNTNNLEKLWIVHKTVLERVSIS